MDSATELPPHQIALASQIRRLGHATMSRRLDPEAAERMAASVAAMADELEEGEPVSKHENLAGRNRVNHFLETGRWPDRPPDGSRLEFDPASVVGGELNPFGMGAEYFRDGDEVVGRVRLGPCYEGPPERVHGGVMCAIFDEVMGSVFRATATPSGFTGELTVRFEAPAPLNADLEFRARRVDADGRRQHLEGEATGPEGRIASAVATFIEMRPDQFKPDQFAG